MADPRVFSGPRSRVTCGGVVLGWLTDISGSEAFAYDEIDCMGVLEVAEYVLVGYRASFQASIVRIIGRSLKSLGIFPTLEAALTSGELSVGVEDKLTGQVVYQFVGARCSEKPFSGSARAHFAENTSWLCTRVLDEFERPAAGA